MNISSMLPLACFIAFSLSPPPSLSYTATSFSFIAVAVFSSDFILLSSSCLSYSMHSTQRHEQSKCFHIYSLHGKLRPLIYIPYINIVCSLIFVCCAAYWTLDDRFQFKYLSQLMLNFILFR